jgi:hypothetical protein
MATLKSMRLIMRRHLPHWLAFSFVCTLIVGSASHNWPLFQMDVKNVFLNGELTNKVYMQLPLDFSHPPGFSHKVCRIRRALYALS